MKIKVSEFEINSVSPFQPATLNNLHQPVEFEEKYKHLVRRDYYVGEYDATKIYPHIVLERRRDSYITRFDIKLVALLNRCPFIKSPLRNYQQVSLDNYELFDVPTWMYIKDRMDKDIIKFSANRPLNYESPHDILEYVRDIYDGNVVNNAFKDMRRFQKLKDYIETNFNQKLWQLNSEKSNLEWNSHCWNPFKSIMCDIKAAKKEKEIEALEKEKNLFVSTGEFLELSRSVNNNVKHTFIKFHDTIMRHLLKEVRLP
jgi:hypothetical protein